MYTTGLGPQQENLFGYPKLIEILGEDHILVKLRNEFPFDDLVEIVSKGYSSNNGAPSKSLRKLIGLELLKKKFGLSDRELVDIATTDIGVMYFCGYEYFTPEKIDSSTMTKFRNRITNEMALLIQEVALGKQINKLHRKKKSSVQTDTTCIPENITYPTDTGLLSKCIEKVTEVIKKIRGKGGPTMRGKRKMKNAIRGFNLKRKKTKKEIKSMKKKLIRYGKKLHAMASDMLNDAQLLASKKMKELLENVERILEQQTEMVKKGVNNVANRIVSLHKPNVRPIYRGKSKAKTEFGAKVTFSLIGGKVLQVVAVEDENTSDTTMPSKAIEAYEKLMGAPPKELSTDRGGHSPANHAMLKEKGIVDGIQYKGKIPKKNNQPKSFTRKRLAKGRSPMEGFIGVVKRKYGMGCNTYKVGNRLSGFVFSSIIMNAVVSQ